MVLGNFLNAHAQRSLAVLVDHKLAVGGQFEDFLILHSVHVVVHQHQPKGYSPALHLVARRAEQMHLYKNLHEAEQHRTRRNTGVEQVKGVVVVVVVVVVLRTA